MNYAKSLTSLKAFLPHQKYIIDIIKYCQLKHSKEDWKIWQDNYGNLLCLDYKRDAKIELNDNTNLQIISSKDLYFKANIKKISSITKYSLIAIGGKKYYIWMLGNDDILRFCKYENDILVENQSILKSGLKNLETIITHAKIEGWQQVQSIVHPNTGIKIKKSYATSWPPANDLLDLLPDVIKKDCNLVKR